MKYSYCNCGPITPSAIIYDSNYWREIESKKPIPRIRKESEWIRDLNEKDSVGILFKIQEIRNRQNDTRLLEEGIKKMAANGYSNKNFHNYNEKSQIGSELFILAPQCLCGKHFIKKEDLNKFNESKVEVETELSGRSTPSSEYCSTLENSNRAEALDNRYLSKRRTFDYLKAHSKTGPPMDVEEYPPISKIDIKNAERVRISVPTARSTSKINDNRREIDYIRANAYALKSGRNDFRDVCNQTSFDMSNYKYGEIPNYIKKKSNNDTNQEPLHFKRKERKLTATEKKEIIDMLLQEKEMLFSELNRLPISMETVRAKNNKKDVENRIRNIDETIEIYKKPNVFIQIDEK